MSFLSQLKSQAHALQSEQTAQDALTDANIQVTEAAGKTAWLYLVELAKQLNVIKPAGPKLSLDGKKPWPDMQLVDFRTDARKKRLRDKEVYDFLVMAWRVVPAHSAPLPSSVSANFPPDLERIEKRLAAGHVKHERVNVRHPEKNTLQAIRFDHVTEASATITITLDHPKAQLLFRLAGVQGFQIDNMAYPAAQVQSPLLDELAKLVVGQPSRFV